MPTWALAASLACLKHSARAALVLSIFFVVCAGVVCADSEVARNGSKAIANSVRILSIIASLEVVGFQRSAALTQSFSHRTPNDSNFFGRDRRAATPAVPRPSPGKVAALLSASTGLLNGVKAQLSLQIVLSKIGVLVIPDSFALGAAHQAFDAEGGLKAANVRNIECRSALRDHQNASMEGRP
jgi:hypothetical protein